VKGEIEVKNYFTRQLYTIYWTVSKCGK